MKYKHKKSNKARLYYVIEEEGNLVRKYADFKDPNIAMARAKVISKLNEHLEVHLVIGELPEETGIPIPPVNSIIIKKEKEK